MMMRIPVLAVAIALATALPLSAQSAITEQSLKTTHESLLTAIQSGNLTMAQALAHSRGLGFF